MEKLDQNKKRSYSKLGPLELFLMDLKSTVTKKSVPNIFLLLAKEHYGMKKYLLTHKIFNNTGREEEEERRRNRKEETGKGNKKGRKRR